MARKRQYYRIATAEYNILVAAALTFLDEHPGSCTDHVRAVLIDIDLRHAPKPKTQALVDESVASEDSP